MHRQPSRQTGKALYRLKEKQKIVQAAKQTKQGKHSGRKRNRRLHRQPSRQSRESIMAERETEDCTGSQSDKAGKA